MANELMDGFKAAAAGKDRDTSQGALWLEGFDGFAIGRAENEKAQAEYDRFMESPAYIAQRKATKAKLRRRFMHSSTPRTL